MASGSTQKRILVVDDDKNVRRLFEAALQPLGHQVVTAALAEEGIALLKESPVHLAILDVFMTGKGGMWALEKIRTTQPQIKTLVISGGSTKGPNLDTVLETARRVGADMALHKPFRVSDIRDAVEKLIGRP